MAASSSSRPADTVDAPLHEAATEPAIVTKRRFQRYNTALDLPLRHFFSKQGLAPGAVSHRVRTLWQELREGSLSENDLTLALMHKVRKVPEAYKRFQDEILHILSTSDSESEVERSNADENTHESKAPKRRK